MHAKIAHILSAFQIAMLMPVIILPGTAGGHVTHHTAGANNLDGRVRVRSLPK